MTIPSFEQIPAAYDLEIYQGDTFSITFRLRAQNSDGSLGAYIDLTGYTPKAQIRATPASSSVLVEFTATLEDQTIMQGGVTISLTHVQTAALVPTRTSVEGAPSGVPYTWDVQLTDPSTAVRTYLAGAVAVVAEVTR